MQDFYPNAIDSLPEPKQQAVSLYAKVGRTDLARQAQNGRIAHSHYDWQTSRIALMEDTLVALLSVYDLQLRIGSMQVRSASINLMDTHPDYKNQDLMDHLTESSLDA